MRAVVRPDCAAGGDLREATVGRARELGVLGWVRDGGDGTLQLHAEGAPAAVDELTEFLQDGGAVASERVKIEGHEQFVWRTTRSRAGAATAA